MTYKRPCPDCGVEIRPSNMLRHRRARHFPKTDTYPFGKRYRQPEMRMAVHQQDRRYDEIAPRGEGPERYRIYRLRAGELDLLATCPDPECVGTAIITLHAEGEFIRDDSLGILDTITDPGKWVANPYSLGRTR